jgi:hypothetical protein
MALRIWDVEHGACAMLHHLENGIAGRLAMIDSGDTADWSPSAYIRHGLNRTTLEALAKFKVCPRKSRNYATTGSF